MENASLVNCVKRMVIYFGAAGRILSPSLNDKRRKAKPSKNGVCNLKFTTRNTELVAVAYIL